VSRRKGRRRGIATTLGATDSRRDLLARFCRDLGETLRRANGHSIVSACDKLEISTHLPPRVRQTLACLLQGDSEKQIAGKLRLSRHTVHDYVKSLHRRFAVSSRGELLARFVKA